MKVIDLLNKIANGEEVPEKIKIEDDIWNYDGIDYRASDDRGYLFEVHTRINEKDLNEEIEIIEEDKKIEKVFHCSTSTSNEEIKFLQENINQLGDKINEIIEHINKGDEE
mgnify:CR=1 FL=1